MDLHVFPIPIPPSHLPLYRIPLGLPSAPAPSTCLMHPTWAGDMQNRKRDTDVQNRLLDSVGEGEGRMFQENSIKTCILSKAPLLIDLLKDSNV